MLKYKKITQEEYAAAVATPIEPVDHRAEHRMPDGRATARTSATTSPQMLQNDPTFGDDEDTRMLNFRRGGYDVYTTLDLDLQGAAVATHGEQRSEDLRGLGRRRRDHQRAGRHRPGARDGAEQASTARTRRCRRPARNYTSINYNTDFDHGGSSGFQPGSTYKVFTLAEWLKEGHSLNERVDSAPQGQLGHLPGQLPRAAELRQ